MKVDEMSLVKMHDVLISTSKDFGQLKFVFPNSVQIRIMPMVMPPTAITT